MACREMYFVILQDIFFYFLVVCLFAFLAATRDLKTGL